MVNKETLLLGDYRVLDLTDEKGYLCGKILADLGADVIKVEKPGGDSSRSIGPFYHNIPDTQRSLSWMAHNANKRSITLNIETADGKSLFERLVMKTDIIIESFPPGYLDGLRLGYSTLSQNNPEIIMASITPFGQNGPYKDFQATDIVVMAMGGVMHGWGDSDRPPVRLSVDQAYYHAATDAAVGSVMALYYREISGEGQHVDVSAQESVTMAVLEAAPYWDINHVIRGRTGSVRASISKESIIARHTWPCKGGFITFEVLGGIAGANFNRALIEWAIEEGMRDESLQNMNWQTFDYVTATQEQHDHIGDFIGTFFLTHTKEELFRGAIDRRIILYPVADVRDIAEDEQLKARDFWKFVHHPELNDTITYPGDFMKSSETSFGIRRRPPLIGENNEEIYEEELGLSGEELLILEENGVI
jgi:crotonobetainyl-CoA:carnitine CoA-transferase CaiB-like acyl-CoA transferase